MQAYLSCFLVSNWAVETSLANGAHQSNSTVPPATLPLNGYYVGEQAPTTLYLECVYGGADYGMVFSSDVEAGQGTRSQLFR